MPPEPLVRLSLILSLSSLSFSATAALAQTAPCLLTPAELAPVYGVQFEPGVVQTDSRGYVSCSYAVAGSRSDRVVIRVEAKMNAERFASLRKSRAMITGKDHTVDGVGDAAFSNEGMFAALKGSTTLEISGFRTAAKRRASLAEGGQLLRIALGRL